MKKLKRRKLTFSVTAILFFIVFSITALFSTPSKGSEFNVKEYLDKTYVTVGVGYKFRETKLIHDNGRGDVYRMNDPLTARIAITYRYSDNLSFGISHHSQWLTGAPFNDREEYAKTEVFIDYSFSLGNVF